MNTTIKEAMLAFKKASYQSPKYLYINKWDGDLILYDDVTGNEIEVIIDECVPNGTRYLLLDKIK